MEPMWAHALLDKCYGFRRGLALVLLLALLPAFPAGAQDLPEDGGMDAVTTVLTPAIIYGLREVEAADPENTVFQIEEGAFEAVGSSGNPVKVAEYMPLSTRASVKRLYFLKALESGLVTLEADTATDESFRVRAAYNDPGLVKMEVRDTRVFHRLDHDIQGIFEDQQPNDVYSQEWQRLEGSARVKLGRDSRVSLSAWGENQSRYGNRQHSWFQIHRFQCTDCHTVADTQGLSESTQSYNIGAAGRIGDRGLVEAYIGESDYDENSQVLVYNYGGPFGRSPVLANYDTRDQMQSLRAGYGEEDYRASLSYYNLDRTNQRTGQTYQGSYLSVQGAARISDQVQLTGGLLSDDRTQSLANNLTRDRSRLYLQVNAHPASWARVTAKVGQEESRRRLHGVGYPQTTDRYYDLRLGLRPHKEVRFRGRYRHDDIDDPFFPTDPADRDLVELSATYSPDPVVVGVNYRNLDESNTDYSLQEESTEAFVTAMIDPVILNANYAVTDVDSNVSGPIYLEDQLNVPLLLQVGYPYRATTQTFGAGVDFPISEVWVRPYYRRTHSKSEALLLPGVFPTVTGDSTIDIVQEAWSLKFDLPVWEDGRLGLGWEQQNWSDRIDTRLDGDYNIFSVYFSTRY